MEKSALRRVLVIDNDEGLAQAVATRLKSQGYECITASNGEEGLSDYSLGEIDLVITDVNMPVLNGVGLIDRIRVNSAVPVIVMTGFFDEYKRELRRIPNVSVLKKPFESQDLLDLVQAELAQCTDRLADWASTVGRGNDHE